MWNRGYRGGGMSFGGMGMTAGVQLLLIANTGVFLLQTLFGGGLSGRPGPLTELLGFVPQKAILGLEVWRFFTYMFVHGGLWHIGFNMLALWMFGVPIEARWGQRSFLVFYTVCGLGGAATYGLFNLAGMSAYVPMIGASGAIFGVLLAYGLTFPDSVILIGLIFPMRAKYAVILFGVIALLSSTNGGSGVAHLAHLAGMITGYVFLRLTVPSVGGRSGLGASWRRWQAKRRMRVVRPESRRGGNGDGRGTHQSGGPPGTKQSEIDAILDKISREGLQSLTDEEQEILRRAGRK